jgi:phosphoinositide-3-kinase regulatory subunit 4
MQELQNHIQEHLAALLMDPSSVVKRAVLHNISSLCIFLGRQKTNDVLLSHMITYLNDRDWLLRCAFFESIVDVAACAGGRSLEDYILPLMIQALSGTSILSMTSIVSNRRYDRRCGRNCRIQSTRSSDQFVWTWLVPENENLGIDACHSWIFVPSKSVDTTRWVSLWQTNRVLRLLIGAAAFIAAAAKHLPSSDAWCILYPTLRHFLKCDIATIDEQSLLSAMKTPVRHCIDSQLEPIVWYL